MRHPALALIEVSSVAIGVRVADVMVKRAPIGLLKAGTVQRGHYLVLIAGSVASVEEAHRVGTETAGDSLLDDVLLPDVHAEVYAATLGARRPPECEALGVLETRRVASLLRAADAGVKGAAVHISEIRLADGLGGKAFVFFDGEVADVEAALEIGAGRVAAERDRWTTIMPRLDDTVKQQLGAGSRFASSAPLEPGGAED
jgi:microcompartment protein CcmL/EutN